ncbi:thiol:disulfide interchange protein DsbA/DsbL [Arenimonas oryziterrae]|uniref:Thiol:disulfide interchange protein DsbA n=1 Tax=Arenimonas oryziterrae DSM 21050 = YC6267 TaxID=1121015 RepID=A0A091BCZ3_9GAMM|nr:thiol:disulfide interchange protein DsbA/DsbL [Arenimonas oryziterrae]KFN42280.1 hypothetical protein N789_14445 [Arenimonas oryziterrae DSM 21050 = YC6267]
MSRRILAALLIAAALAACTKPAPTPDTTATPTTEATTPEATPSTEPSTPATEGTPAPTSAVDTAAITAELAALGADAPRLGTDFEILTTPQPTWGQGGVEVVEVFSYMCIHCAHFQPSVDAWTPKLPSGVRFEYVPGVFGGPWDSFARAFYAAEILGVRERTHDEIFKAVHIDHVLKTGTLEEIADLYGKYGVDRDKFLATMNSFAVTGKLNRAKQFALRTGVTATPTFIVAGKYRVMATPDRSFEGMLKTTDFLIARELAEAAKAAAAPPAATPEPTAPAAPAKP